MSWLLLLVSGELTLEEFISGARDHPDIMDMLTKMMDLTTVLEIIVNGQQKKAVNWMINKLDCVENQDHFLVDFQNAAVYWVYALDW